MRYSVAHPVSRWMLCSKFNTQPRIASTSSGEFPSPVWDGLALDSRIPSTCPAVYKG